jgi:hydrogenase expression/formation protein HypE
MENMLLPKGKLPDALLWDLVLRKLPLTRQLLQFDTSDLRRAGRIVVCVDPVAGIPLDSYGFFAVHYSASDVAVQGARPRYLILDIDYPEGMSSEWLGRTSRALGAEARKYGIEVLGGHTGSYDGISLPFISSTCLGYAQGRSTSGPGAVRDGDRLLVAGWVCLESAWLIASVRPDIVEKHIGSGAVRRIIGKKGQLTALPKALAAVGLGVKCLHDVTEGGLAAALEGLCRATGRSIVVDEDELPYDRDSLSLIRSLGGDPLSASSFGTLLMIASPAQADRMLAARMSFGGPITMCGYIAEGRKPILLSKGQRVQLKRGSDIYLKFSKDLLAQTRAKMRGRTSSGR